MTLTIPIPIALTQLLQQAVPDLNHAALEGIAVQGYRRGALSLADVRELLGFASRWDAQDFLAAAGAWPSYTDKDVQIELTEI
jgi:Uncharacterised protein family (UPF0175)